MSGPAGELEPMPARVGRGARRWLRTMTRAYRLGAAISATISAAIVLALATCAAAAAQVVPVDGQAAPSGGDAIAPDCHRGAAASARDLSPYATYGSVVCSSAALLGQARQIEQRGRALQSRLPRAWMLAFALQQKNFPRFIANCPSDKGKQPACVAQAFTQRLADIDGLAATLAAPPPVCKPAELTLKDAGFGDAGMSKSTAVYLLEYTGSASCRLLGYPAIAVRDAAGVRRPSYAVESGTGAYVELPGAPLPVTLTRRHRNAWFALSSSSGCDAPAGKSGYSVDVATPLSRVVLKTIALPYATCPSVSVTPLGMMSTLRAAIN